MSKERQLGAADAFARPWEKKFGKLYAAFINEQRGRVLSNVEAGRAPGTSSAAMKKRLDKKFRPIYRAIIEGAQEECAPDCVATSSKKQLLRLVEKARRPKARAGLELDLDDLIDSALERLGGTLDTLDDRLERVLAEAPDALTAEELADYMDEELDAFLEDGKVGVIAETEVFGGINAGRLRAFVEEAVEYSEWATAGDDLVREAHVTFGESGAHPVGFNYARLVDMGDTLLRWPHDPECEEPGLVVNCRCILIPAATPEGLTEEELDEELGDEAEEE